MDRIMDTLRQPFQSLPEPDTSESASLLIALFVSASVLIGTATYRYQVPVVVPRNLSHTTK